MELMENAPVAWFVLGFVLFVLEFMVPGLILFFFAIGAWIVALLTFVFDLSLNFQLIIFLTSSVLSILFFRKWAKRVVFTKKYQSELEDEFVGKIGKAETFIGPGQTGKVGFKGTTWDATSADTIQAGENVMIAGNDSIVLLVTANKQL